MSDDHDNTASAMRFIFETGVLKRAARTGWWFAGVTQPESIADHSFRTAIVGMMLAAMEGADPAKVTMLCVLARTTEIGPAPRIRPPGMWDCADRIDGFRMSTSPAVQVVLTLS